jgi:hypothetical protein
LIQIYCTTPFTTLPFEEHPTKLLRFILKTIIKIFKKKEKKKESKNKKEKRKRKNILRVMCKEVFPSILHYG